MSMTTLLVFLSRLAHFFLATKYIKQSNISIKHDEPPPPTAKLPPLSKSTSSDPAAAGHDHNFNKATDIDGVLLSPKNNKTSVVFFPYFMLVAFEAGGLLRAFLLLSSYPLLLLLPPDYQLKLMTFVSFFGLKMRNVNVVGRAVLPKFYSEHLSLEPVIGPKTMPKAVFTSLPRVMVETYLKEYLGLQYVFGSELGKFESFNRFNGLAYRPNIYSGPHFSGPKPSDPDLDGCSAKPVIFHDGRLAFLPTPIASLVMFLWLPLGVILAVVRILNGCIFPYHVSYAINSWTGLQKRVQGLDPSGSDPNKGVLYVCNHRTLLDPVILSIVTRKPLTAVTYSLSTFSEIIAPIKTVSLTRDKTNDSATILKLLSQGDLVVCPEGTTCREPYLLRFSPLFAEVTDEIVLVAMDTKVSMFYGTTASGLKWLDSIFFLMNPTPRYNVRILGKLPKELTCGGGKSNIDVANYAQKKLADALGFKCTNLTRKDKYLTLVGNKGIVAR
uniref:Phospholipid/glycerol acyltransferase domain-containing protein n=1 Tax=Kalanchoe fedtschenkoi TaxID=63787 RepID=A0A7N0T2P4_KALFE